MKKLLSLLLTVAAYNAVTAQNIGIGTTTPHSSAMLDVASTNKGLLVPRVALTGIADVTTVSSPAVSLLVYNTATAGGVTPGYYYWVGTTWSRLNTGSGSSNAWLFNGNTGTIDGTNFIGTTDNIPFNIRVNNQKAGRLDNTNSFWGYQSGNANTIGFGNVAVGVRALFNNTYRSNLVAIGDSALYNNSSGGENTAVGSKALFSNTTGYWNTANGIGALYFNVSGSSNTAIGSYTLADNTTGYNNTAVGLAALRKNITGNYNTASGHSALFYNTTGDNNVADGVQALNSNTTGNGNTAKGAYALASNKTANNNTAIGVSTLTFNTTGYSNVAVGGRALYNNTSQSNLVAVGDSASFSSNGGLRNTAVGSKALLENNDGDNNTATGYNTLILTTGNGNTATGAFTLKTNTSGSNNTALGYSADVSTGNLSNATAIGYNATVNASNRVQIGNDNVTQVFFGDIAVTDIYADNFVVSSDERFKYNIEENVPGLDFIKKLKPVTYYFDEKKLAEFSKTGIIPINNAFHTNYSESKKRRTGFLAQEVEKIAKDLGYNFDGVYIPKTDRDHYSLAYSQFIMPLVKAVQEQQQMIEDLKKENGEMKLLKKQIEELSKAVKALSK